MNEVLLEKEQFQTFNQFFYRKLKAGSRTCPTDQAVAVSPADCRLNVFPSINDATKLWYFIELLNTGSKENTLPFQNFLAMKTRQNSSRVVLWLY
jgi:phosphatidylserine decarboxylase